MSTLQENLDRIKTAKSAIKSAIIEKGVDVADEDKIDTYADKILQIKSGGGTTEIPEFDPDGPLTFYRLDDIGESYVSLGPNALPNIEYSTDKTTWKTYTSNQKIKLGKGEYVQFKYKSGSATTDNNRFNIDGGLYNLYGLFTTLGNINKNTYYKNMFSYLPIIDASNLSLGNTNNIYNSSKNCAYMFQNCILLTGLPKITTKFAAYSCYMFMFDGCVSLKSIPDNYLPTPNEVKDNMYMNMFQNCTGLTTLPSNLITFERYRTQGSYLCYQMFQNCTGLTTLPSNLLPATTLTDSCYNGMFSGCTSLTTIPKLPATTLTDSCYNGMFSGCTSLTTLPSNLLPATTLASSCYDHMFSGCTSLTTLPALPATTLASSCYDHMFSGCTSLVKTPDGWYLPAQMTNSNSCYYMFYNCSKLQKMAVSYSGTITAFHWSSFLLNVSKTGTFYYSKNQTKEKIQSIVPSGWTLLQSTSW